MRSDDATKFETSARFEETCEERVPAAESWDDQGEEEREEAGT
jgi:hypothetical protein